MPLRLTPYDRYDPPSRLAFHRDHEPASGLRPSSELTNNVDYPPVLQWASKKGNRSVDAWATGFGQHRDLSDKRTGHTIRIMVRARVRDKD